MKLLTRLFFLLVLLCTGCQSTPQHLTLNNERPTWLDSPDFAGDVTDVTSAEDIFVLPASTKQQLRQLSPLHTDVSSRTKAIVGYILKLADNDLSYENAATLTAAQTLETGSANCLSLAILAYSIANELGLDAVFQDVHIPEYWTSRNNATWLNGHINLRIRKGFVPDATTGTILLGSDIIVDFDPYTLKKQFPSSIVGKNRIIAMFFNNKAAEAYAEQNVAKAYYYYQQSVAADPAFPVTWSNLAVLYRQQGFESHALQAYQYSLTLSPDSLNTKANLAVLYRSQGLEAKAERLEQQVAMQRRKNPYYFLMLGDEFLRELEFDDAKKNYLRALRLDQNTHEAYFGLAKVYFAQQQPDMASYYLGKAHSNAPSETDKKRYRAKMDVLNQLARVN